MKHVDRPFETPAAVETWRRIEDEATAQVRAELERDETTPLEVGAHIAWTLPGYAGRTDGLTQVHRVGIAQFGNDYTACGDLIPPVVRRVALSPNLVRTLTRCR
jgi:hypothetical protein